MNIVHVALSEENYSQSHTIKACLGMDTKLNSSIYVYVCIYLFYFGKYTNL